MNRSFDSDPLNIRQGNSGLRRTEVFSAVFFYRSGSWMQQSRRRLTADVRLNAYRHALTMSQIYDAATGVRAFRPENVNGNWTAQVRATFYTPLGRRGLSMNLTLSDNFYHSVDLTGTNALDPLRSTVCTNYLSLPVSLNYAYRKLRLGLKAQVAWNHAESRRQDFRTVQAADMQVGATGNLTLPWNLQLATDLTYYAHRGYESEGMNTNDVVWNAQLSKSVLQGWLTFAIIGYDMLGQLSHITYAVNTQGSTETWRNVIPRYAMFRMIFRFNKPPEKRG